MDDYLFEWPSEDMDFWKINNEEMSVNIKWSRNCFEDYKKLAYQFYECGYKVIMAVIEEDKDDIVKLDKWFLPGVFLIRHSIELELKALFCRVLPDNGDIQNTFCTYKHNVSELFDQYMYKSSESFLAKDESDWLKKYLQSLVNIDEKSDMFRFPFENDFLKKYNGKFLDIVEVTNNLLQAFALIKKCIDKGVISEEDKFDCKFKPEFFVFASHGIGNCWLCQEDEDEGFYNRILGYNMVIDYVYNNQDISKDIKFYPILFMFRNTIELCLKRLLYNSICEIEIGKKSLSKRKSHDVKKDLWKNIKPVLVKYANDSGEDLKIVEIVEELFDEIDVLDKKGDQFRYPTGYNLEYRFDNKKVDLSNVYTYYKSIINFLEGCDYKFYEIENYQSEVIADVDMY